MSKASGDTDDEPRTSEDDVVFLEDTPLHTEDDDAHGDAEAFAAAYHLNDEVDILRKAAALHRHDGKGDGVDGLSNAELIALRQETSHRWHQKPTLWLTILCCSLGGVSQGSAQTGINGANLFIPEALGVGSGILGLVNCGMYLGQSCGCWLSQPINVRMGRRGTIWIATLVCLLGNVLSALSLTWPILLFSRLVLGLGLGINASTVGILAAECSPAYIRGGLAVSWQAFTAFGILLGFCGNILFSGLKPEVTWRLQIGSPLMPNVPLLMLIYLCPESPAWHFSAGRYDKALESLYRLRNTKIQAAYELYANHLARQRATKLSTNKVETTTFMTKFTSLFTVPRNRHAVYASYTVMLAQQLCGINIVAFYSTTIFSSSGFSTAAALWASVIFGFVNFIGAFPAVWTMDGFGRRKLLLWTLPAMAVTMAAISLSFGLPRGNTQLILLSGLIYLFCALYSPGMGPVPVAYTAEIYPSSVREMGTSFGTFTASSWATVLSVTFPLLLESLGEQGSFALYAVLNVVAWALCWLFVRETKGIELEKMDAVFESPANVFITDMWVERPRPLLCGSRLRQGWKEIRQDDLEEP